MPVGISGLRPVSKWMELIRDRNSGFMNKLHQIYGDNEDLKIEAIRMCLCSLGAFAEANVCKLSDEEIAAIPTELSQNIAKRIRDAAKMGDVETLNAIAEEIKDQSEFCMPLSKQIIQMADEFDLDGIQELADDLETC